MTIKSFIEEKYSLVITEIIKIEEGIENDNYLVISKNAKYVFRLYSKSRKIKQIIIESQVMKYLSNNGVSVPKIIEVDNNRIFDYEGRFCLLMEFVEGTHIPWEFLSQKLSKNLGLVTAKINLLLKNSGIKSPRKAPIEEIVNNESLKGYHDWLTNNANSFNSTMLEKGLIHSDLSRENILIKNDLVTAILDFDDLCEGYIAWDLGSAATQLFISGDLGIDFIGLKNYFSELKKHLSINENESKAIVYFMVFRNYYVSSIILEKETDENTKKSILGSVTNKMKMILDNYDKLLKLIIES